MAIAGLDILGCADNDWDRKATARAIPHGWAYGAFVNTFGNGVKGVREIEEERRKRDLLTSIVRFQFWNKHVLTPTSELKLWLPRINALAKEFPTTRWLVSHSCEYAVNSSAKGVADRVKMVQDLCPLAHPVLTPMPGAPVVKGIPIEIHGKKTAKRGQFISYDGGVKGEGLYDIDAQKWIKSNQLADVIYAWAPRFNLSESKVILPPNQRTAAPTPDFIKGMCYLFEDPGVVPEPAFTYRSFKAPQLYKSWAEDMQNENSRDNKPMIFVQELLKSGATVVAYNGKEVGKFPLYPDNQPHELERYYSGLPGGLKLYAWQVAEKAREISGYPYFWFKFDKTHYGPFSWFRAPWFYA